MPTDKLQEAILLIKAGDKKGGRSLLIDIVNADPKNETAWLWLVSVVEPNDRIFCLEQVLSINPNHVQARQHLEKLKASEPTPQVPSQPAGNLQPKSNTDARLTGLFIFALGAGLGYWQIVMPILKALKQEEFVSYSSKAAALAPLAMLFGLVYLVFGAEGAGFLSKPPTTLTIVVVLLVVVLCALGGIFGMEYIMNSLGYY